MQTHQEKELMNIIEQQKAEIHHLKRITVINKIDSVQNELQPDALKSVKPMSQSTKERVLRSPVQNTQKPSIPFRIREYFEQKQPRF